MPLMIVVPSSIVVIGSVYPLFGLWPKTVENRTCETV